MIPKSVQRVSEKIMLHR